MLYRLCRRGVVNLRRFSEVQTANPLAKINEGEILDKSAWKLDFAAVPTFTLGNLSRQLDSAYMKYINSLKSIAGGRYNTSFFDSITVYSFMEFVPLSRAAQVFQVSETKFKVVAFDSSNGPNIELALKKSPYNLTVIRDFGDLDVTMKVDKESNKSSALKLFESSKAEVSELASQASKRFSSNKQALEDIQSLAKKVVQDMEMFHNSKIHQISN